jgi:hypothetical protein
LKSYGNFQVCISLLHTDKKYNLYGFKLLRADRGGNCCGGDTAI